jgi:hypothetical protein
MFINLQNEFSILIMKRTKDTKRLKSTKYIHLYLLACLTSLFSCTRPDRLEEALLMAGNNRAELEKVLSHYSSNPADSLKLKSAKFLIENMPWHYSIIGGDRLNDYYTQIKIILQDKPSSKALFAKIDSMSKSGYGNIALYKKYDIQAMTSQYLIHNIESAFNVWTNKPWAKHLSFEDFCEYILPYRIANEPLENWRDSIFLRYNRVLDWMQYDDKLKNSAFWACLCLNDSFKAIHQPEIIPVPGVMINKISLMNNIQQGSCADKTIVTTLLMRSQGIPVAMDKTPQWPFRNNGHEWNTVRKTQGKNAKFAGGQSNPGEEHKDDDKLAKAYRVTYRINREWERLILSREAVPPLFRDLFNKDVTTEYVEAKDITVPIIKDLKLKKKYAYLCVFDNQQWTPVQYGEIRRGKVLYKDMGNGIVYLPAYYDDDNQVKPLNYPFLLNGRGEIRYLLPDTINLRSIAVNRKYPTIYNAKDWILDRMTGGKMEAANQNDFSDRVVLAEIKQPDICANRLITDTKGKKYRYWRYVGPEKSYSNVAELLFYKNGQIQNKTGIPVSGISGNNTESAAFDNDPLTYFNATEATGGWVGLDFGRPVVMDSVAIVPRFDGNSVYIGDLYEIFYWGKTGWVSLGKQKAEKFMLEYDNAPGNALFYIHNITRGNEDRIFTFENGKQILW